MQNSRHCAVSLRCALVLTVVLVSIALRLRVPVVTVGAWYVQVPVTVDQAAPRYRTVLQSEVLVTELGN